MRKSYSEFNFDEDIELMNLTYQMNTGNFVNYEDNYENEDVLNTGEIKNKQPKIGL